MDPIAIALLVIVLISVIAWIIAAQKLKSHSGDDYKPIESSKDRYDTAEIPVIEEATVNQNTIYQNHTKYDMICCPHCDGENLKTADKCDICGAILW